MSNLLLLIILSSIFILSILLAFYMMNKKIKRMSLEITNLTRQFNQKINLITNIVNALTSDLPLDFHPSEREKKLLHKMKEQITLFSSNIHKNVENIITQESDHWNDKFSTLLSALGKTEQNLETPKNDLFKKNWNSISKIRQQSLLLFNDMKEDGVFFRMYSLWTLSSLSVSQQKYNDAWRHIIASLKLYCDSQPELPLTHRLAWNISELLYECSLEVEKKEQIALLEKFHITADEIVSYLSINNNNEENIETLQLLLVWASQLSNFK
ncbi:MAG: hypothetical protein ACRCVW_01965 [Brevinema sp.]